MIIAILGSITAIAVLCWLLFTLAIYALPALGGVAAGMWTYQTGAGLPGSVLVGLVGAALVFGLAQFLILFARPMWVKLAVALTGLYYLADKMRRRLNPSMPPRPADVPRGLFWGALAGFTSYISHAGGPPFQAYTLPQKLPKMVFAGTATILFACVNLMKVPPYVMAGQITLHSLSAILWLTPVALFGAWSGYRLTRVLPEKLFFAFVETALLLLSLKLIADVIF